MLTHNKPGRPMFEPSTPIEDLSTFVEKKKTLQDEYHKNRNIASSKLLAKSATETPVHIIATSISETLVENSKVPRPGNVVLTNPPRGTKNDTSDVNDEPENYQKDEDTLQNKSNAITNAQISKPINDVVTISEQKYKDNFLSENIFSETNFQSPSLNDYFMKPASSELNNSPENTIILPTNDNNISPDVEFVDYNYIDETVGKVGRTLEKAFFSDEHRLVEWLFDGYNKHIRPINENDPKTHVLFQLSLFNILQMVSEYRSVWE